MQVKMTDEEKKLRAMERKQEKYNREHKIINDKVYKMCKYGNHFVLMDEEHFYYNKSNSIDGFNPDCKICSVIKNQNTFNKLTKEEKQKRRRKTFRKHRQKVLAKNKEIKKRNPDPERTKRQFKEWQQNNPEKVKKNAKKHKVKKHVITSQEWHDCKLYFNMRCAYCGLPIEEHYITYKGNNQLGDFHKEHVIDDGRNDIKNCVPSCKSCNCSKREYSLNTWYNLQNLNYTYERYYKIYLWLRFDYKKYIQRKTKTV